MEFEGKLVFVSGSTGGIGKGIAKKFVECNADVIVHGRNEEKVNNVKAEFEALAPKGKIFTIVADLITAEGAKKVIEEIEAIGQPLYGLVNNLGIYRVEKFEDTTDEDWMSMYEINVMSIVRLTRHFLPKMIERNEGRLLALSSECGMKPLPHMICYSVTKTAIISLMRALAERTQGTKVTSNSILAGPTWTEGVATYMESYAKEKGLELDVAVEEYFKDAEPTSLIQRFLTVDEVASTTVFLASPMASGINGNSQRVEGGIVRHI
eukprot:TRINITY_DN13877_c0_g1_i1.p1 TRINITY_DN13877_c0_g1~~TRINITY_DN13877_c0_g1_i1.p1  ORF type:complete len:266 (+),score=82.41 TRINITY_DN13877_c0_g1_i1:251-1048(+)